MMKYIHLVLTALVVALPVSSPSWAQEPLGQSYSALLERMKPTVQALQKNVVIRNAQAAKTPVRGARTFNLDFDGRLWRLIPNPNPPGSGLLIAVDQGDHVKLNITYGPLRDDSPTNFDIDDIQATVDGKPVKGVHLWLQPNSETVVEFDALTPGIRLIRNPSGQIVVYGK